MEEEERSTQKRATPAVRYGEHDYWRLHGLLGRATASMIVALHVMDDLHAELAGLVSLRLERHWSADEQARYLILVREERVAHRRYQAARRWHEAVRGRIWQVELGEPVLAHPARDEMPRQTLR